MVEISSRSQCSGKFRKSIGVTSEDDDDSDVGVLSSCHIIRVLHAGAGASDAARARQSIVLFCPPLPSPSVLL